METLASYDYIWEVLQKERSSNNLQLIPKSFYDDINAFLTELTGQKPKSEETETTIENIKKISAEIAEKRKQKILLYAAYKRPLPIPTVREEQEFYEKITEMYKNTKFFVADSTTNAKPVNKLKVVVESLPEVFLPSGAKLGPLAKGQYVEISADVDKDFLIDNAICIYEKA